MSVCGTGATRICLADFLGSMITPILPLASDRHTVRFGSRPGFAWGDQRLHPSTGYSVLLRPRVTPRGSNGILTVSSIGVAVRLSLRSRLTLIRLALIRKPQSSGEGVSRPLYRYLYLHLLFQTLQPGSSPNLRRGLECSPTDLSIPRLRQLAYARLLSMPDPSTSELLRTL